MAALPPLPWGLGEPTLLRPVAPALLRPLEGAVGEILGRPATAGRCCPSAVHPCARALFGEPPVVDLARGVALGVPAAPVVERLAPPADGPAAAPVPFPLDGRRAVPSVVPRVVPPSDRPIVEPRCPLASGCAAGRAAGRLPASARPLIVAASVVSRLVPDMP